MSLVELRKALKSLQMDVNVITVCSISLNSQLTKLIDMLGADDDDFSVDAAILQYVNFATALGTFVDSLDAFEKNADKVFGGDDDA